MRTAGIGLGLIAAAVLAGGPGLTPACAQVRDGVAATALAASAIYQVNATAFDLNSRIIATAQDLFQTLIQLPRSCPVFAGSGSLLTEDTCVWVRVTAEAGAWSSTTRHAIDWQAGGQFEVAPGWLLGASVETGGSSSLMPDGRSSAGRSFSAALVAKRIERQLLLSGSLAIFSATDQNAWQVRGTNSTTAVTTSSVNAFGAGLMLRGAYQFPLDPVYLRPILEVAVGFTSQSGLQEAGPAAALTVDPGSKVSTQIAPALEVGCRVDCGSVILRPYVVAGPIFLPDNSRQLSGTLGGAPFSGTVYGKNVLAHVEAGLQVYQSKSWEAKLEYRLIAADQLLDHVLSLRTAKHF